MDYITVTEAHAHERIDKFLANYLQISRHKVQKAIGDQLVYVNGCLVKSNYVIRNQDVILAPCFLPIDEAICVEEAIPLDILYEDEYLLIVNKPAQMVVHPDATYCKGTLANALMYYYPNLPLKDDMPTRPGLVHRLDKDTSGLLVVAKTAESLLALAKQFYEHTVERIYYALVWGDPKEETGCIDLSIGKRDCAQRVYAFPNCTHGKRAITHYRVVERLHHVSLLECKLETGRTHQIRVHMQYIGHPLFGDPLYGGNVIHHGERYTSYKAFVRNCLKWMPYQALHAAVLGFEHPATAVPMRFEVALPAIFVKLIAKWKKYITARYHAMV